MYKKIAVCCVSACLLSASVHASFEQVVEEVGQAAAVGACVAGGIYGLCKLVQWGTAVSDDTLMQRADEAVWKAEQYRPLYAILQANNIYYQKDVINALRRLPEAALAQWAQARQHIEPAMTIEQSTRTMKQLVKDLIYYRKQLQERIGKVYGPRHAVIEKYPMVGRMQSIIEAIDRNPAWIVYEGMRIHAPYFKLADHIHFMEELYKNSTVVGASAYPLLDYVERANEHIALLDSLLRDAYYYPELTQQAHTIRYYVYERLVAVQHDPWYAAQLRERTAARQTQELLDEQRRANDIAQEKLAWEKRLSNRVWCSHDYHGPCVIVQ